MSEIKRISELVEGDVVFMCNAKGKFWRKRVNLVENKYVVVAMTKFDRETGKILPKSRQYTNTGILHSNMHGDTLGLYKELTTHIIPTEFTPETILVKDVVEVIGVYRKGVPFNVIVSEFTQTHNEIEEGSVDLFSLTIDFDKLVTEQQYDSRFNKYKVPVSFKALETLESANDRMFYEPIREKITKVKEEAALLERKTQLENELAMINQKISSK